MSFKVEVLASDRAGKWSSNELRFLTLKEAHAYAAIAYRSRQTRIVACSDPINYREPDDEPIPDHDYEKGD
jgi:hypothetical protein